MNENKFNASERPKLDDDGEISIVKVNIDGFDYEGMYDNGWWVNYGGNTIGYREIDEHEIDFWTY